MNNIITVAPDIDHAVALDAEWVPAGEEWESPTKITDPYRYIRRCTMIRRSQSHKLTAFVQRLLAGSFLLLAMALLIG